MERKGIVEVGFQPKVVLYPIWLINKTEQKNQRIEGILCKAETFKRSHKLKRKAIQALSGYLSAMCPRVISCPQIRKSSHSR
jgi:hypothetical protein